MNTNPSPEYLFGQGKKRLSEGKPGEAIPYLRQAQQAAPENPLFHVILGVALTQAGDLPQALGVFAESLALAPHSPDILFCVGDTLDRAGQTDIAESIYRQLLAAFPDHLPASHNLGALFYRTERFEQAVKQHQSTLQQHPAARETWRDLGQAWIASGCLAEGIKALETALKLCPTDRNTRFALGLAYLRDENWSQGWPLYEARWLDHEQAAADIPAWQGECLQGKHLLVTAEQGYGDNIMFSRYLPALCDEAARITLMTPRPLKRLFTLAFSGHANLLTAESLLGIENIDFQIPIGSLPLHGLSRSIPVPPLALPYLRASRTERPPLPRFSFGLVWRGQARYVADQQRSLQLETLFPQLPEQNFTYFSLQIDATDQEKAGLEKFSIHPSPIELHDFQHTADVLAMLDGVICVDTSIAHLAGAMGKKVILLHRTEGEWRWGMSHAGTAWYKTCYPVCVKNGLIAPSRNELAEVMKTGHPLPFSS